MMTNVETMKIPEGYKQTEVGVIPEDWSLSTIEDVSLVPMQNGLFYEPKRKGKGVPLINVGDMYTAAPIELLSLDLFDANYNEIKVFKVQKGDLFFTRSSIVPSGIAYCNIFTEENEIAVFDSHLIRVRPDQRLMNASFLYLNCIANYARKFLISSAKTATMTTIDQGAIKKCPVLVPPIIEQTAIANALSDVDNLIAALETLIAKKSAIKTAAMQQLLTGKKRLPGFAKQNTNTEQTAQTTQALQTDKNSDVANSSSSQTATRLGYKHTELGEVPEDWSCVPLGQIANIKTGSKNNQDNETDGVYPFYVRSENVQRLNTFSYDCEAILIPGEGGIGSIFHYINGKFDAHQRVYVIRQFTGSVGKFVYYQIRQRFGEHAMKNSVKATVDSLRLPTLQEFMIFLPSIEEQTAISNVFSDMDTEIDALQQRLSKTQKIKQGMMQELLTGKTRLV